MALFAGLGGAAAQESTELYPCGNDDYYSPWLKRYLQSPAAFPRNDELLYLPLQIHSVGADDSTGHMQLHKILDAFCNLNADFEPTNIQFYLAGPINYIHNTSYFDHEYQQGFQMMNTYNVPAAINCYIVDSPAGNCGYYSPGADAIALAKGCNGPVDHTWAHEIGHMLSLPHTFYGWEGNEHDFELPAPFMVDGWPVERLSGVNCQFAADGFCDTPPDYLNYRWSCNSNLESTVVQLDPDSVAFRSDASFFMSYARDPCMNRFSGEQIDAMRANVLDERTELLTPDNAGEFLITDDTIHPIYPADDELVEVNGTITINWEPVPGATHYIVQVNPFPIFTIIFNYFVVDEPSVTVENVLDDKTYYWRVFPYSPYSSCAGWSAPISFETAMVTSTEEAQTRGEDITVFPNPVQDRRIQARLTQAAGAPTTLELFDALGRQVYARSVDAFVGSEILTISALGLPKGIYWLRWRTERGEHTRKLILQH